MIHIAICDDEKEFVKRLQQLLDRYSLESGEAIRTVFFKDGMELIENYPMDINLIFLDIRMERMDGLEAANHIRKRDLKVGIVFVTSLEQYALQGYHYNAINYIIKPITYARLKSVMDKWISQFKQSDQDFILVANDKGKYKVFLSTLRYVETYSRNVLLHTEAGDIVCYRKMKELEEELSGKGFVRCHSGFIVNLFFVKGFEKLNLELISGEHIPISQPKRKYVTERLARYWGDML